jgi:hypothetical protein
MNRIAAGALPISIKEHRVRSPLIAAAAVLKVLLRRDGLPPIST